jgi:ribosomal protein S18 acetylase RimI-like enzyme
MENLTIRRANAEDLGRIAELIAGEPGREAIGIAGCEEAARKFGTGLVRLPNSPQGWRCSTVAEADGQVVGVLQSGRGDTEPFRMTPRLALLALRTFGVGIVSVLGRYRARLRVNPSLPPDAYYIAEFDVDPEYRNKGVGARLLEHAEQDARGLGLRKMSLVTTTDNPARRLYERHGFGVVETKTDSSYERYTGIAGRLLMVKDLS